MPLGSKRIENINIDINGIALRDIKAGEEILEWYTKNIYKQINNKNKRNYLHLLFLLFNFTNLHDN